MGYVGIYKFGIIEERKKIRNYSIVNKSTPIISKQKNEHIIALEKIMIEQKKYLDINLSLDFFAEELKISKTYLSRIINSELGINFNDYVNSFRVEEAKQNLLNPEFSNYTLISIGLESGFNSRSAFNSVFKKITGLTPSEFKNKSLS
jgi:AraC-like DNA-binding protein